jgi:hypothetical protein
MTPLFCIDGDLSTAYVSYRPSGKIVRQVGVGRGRTGRLGAIPFGRTFDAVPHLIADYDAAGELVGVQIFNLGLETLSLAAEFLTLVELPVPVPLARTIAP